MLKKKRLLSNETLAVARKPQYKVLSEVKDKAIEALRDWFKEEYRLPGCHAMTLAGEIIPEVIAAKEKAIHSTAPDVFVPQKDALDSVLLDGQNLAMRWDEEGKLEEILEEDARREEAEKYGI